MEFRKAVFQTRRIDRAEIKPYPLLEAAQIGFMIGKGMK
jgi:hypothetical protein